MSESVADGAPQAAGNSATSENVGLPPLPAPRVRTVGIRAPHRSLGLMLALLYIAGLLAIWFVLPYLILLPIAFSLVLNFGRVLSTTALMWILVIIGIAIVIVLSRGWYLFLTRLRDAHWQRDRIDRIHRLKRVLERPNAATRLPHRRLELELLTRRATTRLPARMIQELPPGWLIVINPAEKGIAIPAHRKQQPFEPLDLKRDAQGLMHLWYENTGWTAGAIAMIEQMTEEFQRAAPWYAKAGRAMGRVHWFLVLYLLWVSPRIYRAIKSGQYDYLLIVAFVISISYIPALLSLAIFDRALWLVPRGIVLSEAWQWSSRRRITRVGPERTSLVIDVNQDEGQGTAQFVANGKRHTRKLPVPTIFAIAAGWLSTAAPPSDEQVQAFVNPE
ncbi:MAG: hypothetical protein SF069_08165 [Phycisphaerae bacterium]|nr:hypothetical protein [Phycisphaerae bacterium]